jgi:hypothetical protein
MARKDNTLKILLDDESNKNLHELATLTEDSKAKVIRDAINWRHKMQLQGVPTCSNGRPCFVAHLHLIQTMHATPITNPNDQERSRLVGPPIVVGF